MTTYNLCLTLGHNASAVLVENGDILNAYENERITGIKSDSSFPEEAIKELGKYHELGWVRNVYVSHWSTDGDVDSMSYKHWRRDILSELVPNGVVAESIDHHDAHVEILRVFTGEVFDWEIVADGFGNWNEVLSIYHKGQLVHRCFGFEKSIGLLYQYATAYLGLKMNQDEWKLLGYEAHVRELFEDEVVRDIQRVAYKFAKDYSRAILENNVRTDTDLVAGLEALPTIRMEIRHYLDYTINTRLNIKKSELTDTELKALVAFFIQTTVEVVFEKIISEFEMKEVALTGGVFMNVKLNNSILRTVDRISVLPICGDLSCGIGVYQFYNHDLKWPGHLNLGIRYLQTMRNDMLHTKVFNDVNRAVEEVQRALNHGKIVNFVCGNMEFGSRALGHTSTLALPIMDNVHYINMLNKRDTSMPMAPMILDEFVSEYDDSEKVHKSLEYMVITLSTGEIPSQMVKGAHHNHPVDGSYSARPQIIGKGHFLYDLLYTHGMLINTSFNYHGQTIPLTVDQLEETINFQNSRDVENRVVTIICIG